MGGKKLQEVPSLLFVKKAFSSHRYRCAAAEALGTSLLPGTSPLAGFQARSGRPSQFLGHRGHSLGGTPVRHSGSSPSFPAPLTSVDRATWLSCHLAETLLPSEN